MVIGQDSWRMGALFALIVFAVLSADSSRAQTTALNSAQMIEVKLPAPQPRGEKAALKKLKAHELKSEWLACAKAGNTAWTVAGNIRGWVLLSWMKCAAKADKAAGKLQQLTIPLKHYQTQLSSRPGPWSKELTNLAIESRLWALENSLKSQPLLANQYLGDLFFEIEAKGNSGSDLARAWAVQGDVSQAKHDLAGAEAAFRQSLKAQASAAVQEKLKTVRLALNRVEENKTPAANNDSAFSETEANFAKRFAASKEKNDPILQLEDAIAYLRELPNGLMASKAVELILDIHADLMLRMFSPGGERWKLVEERAVATILGAEADRLRGWLPVFYRRGDYAGALRLGEKIVKKYDDGVFGDEVLWYTARAAQLTGDLKKADGYFASLLEKHSGSSFARDAELQWALVHLRRKNYSSAVASLEKLLRAPDGGKLELQARYWMVRAFEAQASPRAAEEAKLIFNKFPTSYYGIRLRAEAFGGDFEWPFAKDGLKNLKASLRLNGRQKAAWDRMQVLRANAFQQEALQEADELPLPDDALLKVLWAQELSRAEAYPKVIRLLNEVGDLSPELRSLDVLRLGLPLSHVTQINAEAAKQSLNPVLLRSLIRQESAFNPWAVSRANALGLMQLMPPTAREVAKDLRLGDLGVPEDVFKVENNIQMGSAYLARMIKSFSGSVPFALAAYNAGPRRMEMFLAARPELTELSKNPSSAPLDEIWFDELPWSETSFYVKAILRNSLLYKAAEASKIKLSGVLWQDLVVRPASEKVQAN